MSHGLSGPALLNRGPVVTSSENTAATRAQKATMRAEALARRASTSDSHRADFAIHLAAIGPGLIPRRTPGSRAVVSAFLPIRGEPDCRPLMHALVAAGLDTALPVTPKRGLPLRFHLWRPGEPLVARTWGISEPGLDTPEVDPDVLFVPLAAFDRRGHRLGYGAGFYDNALAVLRARKPVLAIGVAFALQELEAVPAEPHDERLDMIITEQATHIVTGD